MGFLGLGGGLDVQLSERDELRVRAGFPGWTTEWLVIPFARRTTLAAWN